MTEKELNEILYKKVQENGLCAQCIYKHDDGICFFAYSCLYKYKFSNFQSVETGA